MDKQTPDTVVVLNLLERGLEHLRGRLLSVEVQNMSVESGQLREMIEAVVVCIGSITGDTKHPPIPADPRNLICASCGSAEIECLDWVRVNDNVVIGGNDSPPADEYWCPRCEIHDKPVLAEDHCTQYGHRGAPCAVCGAENKAGV